MGVGQLQLLGGLCEHPRVLGRLLGGSVGWARGTRGGAPHPPRRCRAQADAPGGSERVRDLQREVEGVKSIMSQNVERILARGENLEHLRNKTEDLEATVRGHCGDTGDIAGTHGREERGWGGVPRSLFWPRGPQGGTGTPGGDGLVGPGVPAEWHCVPRGPGPQGGTRSPR